MVLNLSVGSRPRRSVKMKDRASAVEDYTQHSVPPEWDRKCDI